MFVEGGRSVGIASIHHPGCKSTRAPWRIWG